MYEIDDNTVVVESAEDLILAVSPAYDYNYIYLGQNIQIPDSGIVIDPAKTELVIDGLRDNEIHAITDNANNSDDSTLGITAASSITLTLKNMAIIGNNYHGVPYITNSQNTDGVTLIYDNVTYTGPQMTYNPRGLTRYIDCDITISYPASTLIESEVGEVNRVEFGGVNTIFHNISSASIHSAFWFRGSTLDTASFKVLRGASVSIRTTNYFMYCLESALPNPVAFELEPGASFELTAHHGFVQEMSHRIKSFLIDTGASFKYVQETSNALYRSMYLNGDFVVNDGARVHMEASYSGAMPIIAFMSGGVFSITNPKSFVIYCGGSAALDFSSTRTFSFTGRQLNIWTSSPSATDPGGIDDAAQNRWYKPDLSWDTFMISGSVTVIIGATTYVTDHSFTQDELLLITDLNLLQLQNARTLSIGNLTIVDNPIMDDERAITGWTEPMANVRIEYDGVTINNTSNEKGRYAIEPAGTVPAGTSVSIKSNTPFLITTNITEAIIAGELGIMSAPAEIVYSKHPVSSGGIILLHRTNPTEPVVVEDTRTDETPWQLWASVPDPLETQSGDVWENGVVFIEDSAENREVLGVEPVLVFTGDAGAGTSNIFWDENHGILVELNQPVRFGVQYTSYVTWDLRIING